MNNLVKIKTSDDGDERPGHLQVWHLVVNETGGNCTFCEQEFFGFGESGCEYETNATERGGITCEQCIEKIKKIKAVKL